MDNNKRITIKELHAASRGQLIGKYGVAIFAALVVSIIRYMVFVIEAGIMTDSSSSYLTGLLIDFIISLLFGVLSYGQAVFFLKLVRNDKTLAIKDIFSGVKTLFDKAILVESVFVGFSILGIIPSVAIHFGWIAVPADRENLVLLGVLALQALLILFSKLYFGPAFYIMADHNDMTPVEVLKESMYLMTNKKGRLILIYLSLIPLFIVSTLACGVGLFWFNVFSETLFANFYIDLIGEEVRTEEEKPTEPPKDGWSTLDIRL